MTTPNNYRDAYRALSAAQKSNKGAPAYSRFVNRPLGRRFAAAAHGLGMTPNAVTGVSAVFSLAGIVLLALAEPSWWVGLIVAATLVVGYALDSADGQVARLRGGGSPAGEWLDHTIDAAKITSLHLAVLFSAHRYFGPEPSSYLLVPLGFLLVANVMFFSMVLKDLLAARHQAKHGSVHEPDAPASALRALVVIPTDYGLLCLVFVLLAAPDLFFIAYAVLLAGNALFLAAALPKWYRDCKALTV